MLAQAHTFTLDGPLARHVVVELDVRAGLPAFTIVGLADAAVREARERIQTAIRNSGFQWPARRVTANLAPGDLRKAGPGLDLALACAILAATGQVPAERLRRIAMFGELGLDGSVHPAQGTLAVADAARSSGLRALALAAPAGHAAGLVEGLEVAPLRSLQSAARLLRGGPPDPLPARFDGPHESERGAGATDPLDPDPDLADFRGAPHAVRALLIAAAGAHSLLLRGPPGAGKTMLARRLPGILPPLGPEEAVEVARLRGLSPVSARTLDRRRPFRAPHHTATAAGLVGGAANGRLGEAVLAHRGVLFLDELGGVLPGGAGGAAPARGGRVRDDRPCARVDGPPCALHARVRDEPVPLRGAGWGVPLLGARPGASRAAAERAVPRSNRRAHRAGRSARARRTGVRRLLERAGPGADPRRARAPGRSPRRRGQRRERGDGRPHARPPRAPRRAERSGCCEPRARRAASAAAELTPPWRSRARSPTSTGASARAPRTSSKRSPCAPGGGPPFVSAAAAPAETSGRLRLKADSRPARCTRRERRNSSEVRLWPTVSGR